MGYPGIIMSQICLLTSVYRCLYVCGVFYLLLQFVYI